MTDGGCSNRRGSRRGPRPLIAGQGNGSTAPAPAPAGAPPVWGHISHPATGLALPVPPGWQAVRDTGAALVLAWPAGPGQAARFRPNAVATVERPPAAITGISAYTAASVVGLQRMLTGLHVIAIDVVTIGGQDGRRVLCGYRDGAYAIAAGMVPAARLPAPQAGQ